MGFLTKLTQCALWYFLSYLTCNSDLLPPEARVNSQTDSSFSSSSFRGNLLKRMTARSFSIDPAAPNTVYMVIYLSILFDLMDWSNVVVDLIFTARLFAEVDAAIYASLLLAGLILGRLVGYRGTTLLFVHGIDWNPFWITPTNRVNTKSQQVFSVLYCLVFTEVGVFLLEDYPSLVVYAHWSVLQFPPPLLDLLGDVNVALSAVSLFAILTVFLVAICASLFLLIKHEFNTWALPRKLLNGAKILVFLTASVFLARFTLNMTMDAVEIVLQGERKLPSNKILGIQVCKDVTFQEREEFCSERVYILRVVTAWVSAAVFSGYLFFCPAHYDLPEGGSSTFTDGISHHAINGSTGHSGIIKNSTSSRTRNKEVAKDNMIEQEDPPRFCDDESDFANE